MTEVQTVDLRSAAKVRWNRDAVPLRAGLLTLIAVGFFGVYVGLDRWINQGDVAVGGVVLGLGALFVGFDLGAYLWFRGSQIVGLDFGPDRLTLRLYGREPLVFSFKGRNSFQLSLEDRSHWKSPSRWVTGSYSVEVLRKGSISAPVAQDVFDHVRESLTEHGVKITRFDREDGLQRGSRATIQYYTTS